MLNPLANGKIQGLFKAFECFSSTFQGKFYFQGLFKAFECFSSTLQGKFYFQGLFKTFLNIQVLFKPVGTLQSNRIFHSYQLHQSIFVLRVGGF